MSLEDIERRLRALEGVEEIKRPPTATGRFGVRRGTTKSTSG